MIKNSIYPYSVTLFDNMGTFHILADVIFVRSDIYQLKSAIRENTFLLSKSVPALF